MGAILHTSREGHRRYSLPPPLFFYQLVGEGRRILLPSPILLHIPPDHPGNYQEGCREGLCSNPAEHGFPSECVSCCPYTCHSASFTLTSSLTGFQSFRQIHPTFFRSIPTCPQQNPTLSLRNGASPQGDLPRYLAAG